MVCQANFQKIRETKPEKHDGNKHAWEDARGSGATLPLKLASPQLLLEAYRSPPLLLELFSEGLDPLPIDFGIGLPNARGGPVFNPVPFSPREPEFDVVDELIKAIES